MGQLSRVRTDHQCLMLIYPSSNPLSVFYVRKLALYILRSYRVARQETETLTVLSSAPASSEPTACFPAPFIVKAAVVLWIF
jgi:hypothetical protein